MEASTRDYAYCKTEVKVSSTDHRNKWHVTLWHHGKNLDIRQVRARTIHAAAIVAVNGYILNDEYGRDVTTNLRIIKGTM